MTRSDFEAARDAFRRWEDEKPKNFWDADPVLRTALRRRLGPEAYEAAAPELRAFGGLCATTIDRAVREEAMERDLPRLEIWSPFGERQERVVFHPNHDRVGRILWESGMLALPGEPGHYRRLLTMYCMLAHNGEAGWACPVIATVGLARSIQHSGDRALADRYLPRLLSTDYEHKLQGAFFLTEIQGGSDVGANATQAIPGPSGSFRLRGEKWFCSNVNADLFMMSARVADGGTRGLAVFVAPRELDGRVNGFRIRRLKDKFGTRTLASAEVDFDDMLAWPLGPVAGSFARMARSGFDVSRLFNAAVCAGMMRRAFHEASTYARHRSAFGRPLIHYSLVQEALADIHAQAAAATELVITAADMLDRIDLGDDAWEDVLHGVANAAKYITSVQATACIHRAIEVLGGNGAIETFSVLPRLYRDALVYETWEGTHNVLAMQLLRDAERRPLAERLRHYVFETLDAVRDPALAAETQRCKDGAARLFERWGEIRSQGPDGHIHAERLLGGLGLVLEATALMSSLEPLDDESRRERRLLCQHLVHRQLERALAADDDPGLLDRLGRLFGGAAEADHGRGA